MAGGLILMAAALLLAGYNGWEARRAEDSSSAALRQLLPNLPVAEPAPALPEPVQETVIPDYLLNPDMEMPTVEIGGQDYIGVLTIPVLELELPVISEWSYARLKLAPCRFKGSAYLNDLIIAAHNYWGHFGPLKNLQPGDAVTFTDADGHVFSYAVAQLETLGRDDLDQLESGSWDLTLFTCTLGGESRVVVRCAAAPQPCGRERAAWEKDSVKQDQLSRREHLNNVPALNRLG